MTLFQWYSLSGSLIFLLIVLWAIYRSYLREGYALLWIATTVCMILFSLVPKLLDWIAGIVGIHTPAFVLLLFLLCGMLSLIFQQSIVISKHNEKIKRLAEELALLQAEKRESGNDK